jgi:hypothetical protein
MKTVSAAIVAGIVLLYFIDSAFKISILDYELFVHSLIRFVSGFFLLGLGVFYAHQIKLKTAFYIVLALVLADDIYDYVRKVDSFSPEIMLHSIFVLLWGAAVGYLFFKHIKLPTAVEPKNF